LGAELEEDSLERSEELEEALGLAVGGATVVVEAAGCAGAAGFLGAELEEVEELESDDEEDTFLAGTAGFA